MTQIVELFTFVSSAVIMAADIGIVIIIVALIGRSARISRLLLDFVSRYAIFIGFMMAAGSLAGSLFYSNYAGFAPCSLCWIQRIFIYPLVPIFAIALWKNDRNVADYALSLSVIGTLVAAYHTYIQFGGVSLVPCSATVSCVQ